MARRYGAGSAHATENLAGCACYLRRLAVKMLQHFSMREQSKGTHPVKGKPAKASVMIVDDEAMLLELATVILEPAGFEVHAFRDPLAALEMFSTAKSRPTIVITDYSMLAMSGLELMKAVRKIDSQTRILVVSGTVDESLFEGTGQEPDGFLAKPYHPKDLIESVTRLLEPSP
jgi:CheY-like chemotaxis protein